MVFPGSESFIAEINQRIISVTDNSTFWSQLEIVKDVTKEIIRRNLIQTR